MHTVKSQSYTVTLPTPRAYTVIQTTKMGMRSLAPKPSEEDPVRTVRETALNASNAATVSNAAKSLEHV